MSRTLWMVLFVFFVLNIIAEVVTKFSTSMLPQPVGTRELEKSAILRKFLLVATLDGTLSAFDKYSGALYWETNELSGALLDGKYPSSLESAPLYLFEPVGPAPMYAYIPGSGIQKLPVNIKGLIDQSPIRWPDGTLFIGHKSTQFFALDISTGKIVYKYEHGPGLSPTCPSDEVLAAFSGESLSLILLAKSSYSLECFAPGASELISDSWNVAYSEFSGFVNPFAENTRNPVRLKKPESNWKNGGESIHVHSSINGVIIVRDATTKQIMWVRHLASAATTFFGLQNAADGSTLGPIVISMSIHPFLGEHKGLPDNVVVDTSREILVNVGNIEGKVFVLPSDLFPVLRGLFEEPLSIEQIGDKDNRPNVRNLSPNSLEIDDESRAWSYDDIDSIECRPGTRHFPACLVGSRVAKVLRPVPRLGQSSPNREHEEYTYDQLLMKSIFVSILVILVSALVLTRFYNHEKRRRGERVDIRMAAGRLDAGTSPRPPGFEEISISSADSFYLAQDETDDQSRPKSFIISNEIIGYGSHGTVVFKGTYDHRPVAIKRMLIDFYDITGHEVNLLQQSDHHPNVIRYFCREVTHKFSYIVLELCSCSLADVIEDTKVKFKSQIDSLLKDSQTLLRQMVAGLGHLHELNLVHRDIKPHNILFTPQNRIVLSDFGVSKKLAEDQTSFNPTIQAGTVGWRAPECILNEESIQLAHTTTNASYLPDVKISRSVDIFALGCVFYYALSHGDHPFGGRLEREMNIVKNQYDLNKLQRHPEAADLIVRMIHRVPKERPTCQQILDHPFFWSAQKQITFLLDVSDRLEFEDKLPSSEILRRLESRRTVIFEGNTVWHKLIDSEVWYDLCNYRKYNSHSVRDLLRALRNKRSHFHELSPELRKILGETPKAFMKYFLIRFPRLLIEVYRLVESSPMRNANPFVSVYFPHQNTSV